MDWRNKTKKSQTIVGFKDNCIWIGDDKFPESSTE